MGLYRTDEVASLTRDRLNETSASLYDAGIIQSKVVFGGTSDFITYERWQTQEYTINDNQLITPFILNSINFAQDKEDYTRYEEQFTLSLYGFVNQKEDIEKIFAQYTNEENTVNRVTTLDGVFRVAKDVGKLIIEPSYLNAQDGSDETRFVASLDFIWSFAEGITTSDDITITIDTIPIPYNMISFTPEKRNINTQDMSITGIDKYMSTTTGYN
jgi:uncharacterized protein YifE (UPF0438 family)